MSTLLNRAKKFCEDAARLDSAGVEKERFDRLNTRARQIGDALHSLEEAHTALRLLSARRLRPSKLPKPSSALRGKAPALLSVLAKDWREFADDRQIVTTLVDPVKKHADKLSHAALTEWQTHVDVDLPSIRPDFIAAMSAAGFEEQCNSLKAKLVDVNSLRRRCPSSADEFRRIEELKSEIQAVWKELSGVPEDVIEFLKKAAQRRATIMDLTPGIKAWLKDNEMLDKLRIGLG